MQINVETGVRSILSNPGTSNAFNSVVNIEDEFLFLRQCNVNKPSQLFLYRPENAWIPFYTPNPPKTEVEEILENVEQTTINYNTAEGYFTRVKDG